MGINYVFLSLLTILSLVFVSAYPNKPVFSQVKVGMNIGSNDYVVVDLDQNQQENDMDVELVVATFDDKMVNSGWGQLRVRAIKTKYDGTSFGSPKMKMFAAGVAEGYLTAEHIWDHVQNMYSVFYKKTGVLPSGIKKWFEQNTDYLHKMVDGNKDDAFWVHVGLVHAQTKGLSEGYSLRKDMKDKPLDFWDLYFVNSIGDLLDLHVDANITKPPQWDDLSAEMFDFFVQTTTHCSALIRATGALDDIIISHSSWFSYSSMNRIFKHYHFDLGAPNTAAHKVSFSSYPGMISSLDDFYMMDSGLVMTQTTNNVFNNELFDLVKPQSVLAWYRVRVACTMAASGKEWSEIVARENSGTYNNQYMVVDFNKFEKGVALNDGTLWVVEQIPGHVEYQDMTSILRNGHWPSYNVPFFDNIYNASGYPDVVKKRGVKYSYQMAPRARIFRRDAGYVHDIDGMKKIMRYNDYINDPLSEGDPAGAICSRYDLEPGAPVNSGCYDTKVTNSKMYLEMKAFAINGPTTGNGNIPVFDWEKGPLKDEAHKGMEGMSYDFDFIQVGAQWDVFPNHHPL